MSTVFLNSVINFTKTQILTQQLRYYARGWSHRRPKNVYTAEEYTELDQKYNRNSPKFEEDVPPSEDRKINWAQSREISTKNLKTNFNSYSDSISFKIKPKNRGKPLVATNQISKKVAKTDMLETVIDNDGNFVYTKMVNNDPRVGLILTEVKSKKEKADKDLILLEGKRLIKDALLANCRLRYIIFSRTNEVEYLKPYLPKLGAQLYKMPYKEMQLWSDLTTTPGIMGIFNTPNISEFTPHSALPLTIICDNIREPGNLGAILRVCAGVGCQQVILTKGCVDLWDSKVLRSSMGAHFKLKIHRNLNWGPDLEKQLDANAQIFIADNRLISSTENLNNVQEIQELPLVPYFGIDFANLKHVILVVGGETLGISEKSYEFAFLRQGARINIPLTNDIESLNVGAALSVIAFEIKRQLTRNKAT